MKQTFFHGDYIFEERDRQYTLNQSEIGQVEKCLMAWKQIRQGRESGARRWATSKEVRFLLRSHSSGGRVLGRLGPVFLAEISTVKVKSAVPFC